MINTDKVLIGLGQHISGRTPERCGCCPYFNGDAGYGVSCRDELLDDLYEMLEAQEPRLLSVEEAANLALTGNICEWLWIEEAQRFTWNLHCVRAFVYSKHPDTGGFYIMANAYRDIVKLEGVEYGKTWRIWTSCPTDTQREAEPWH